MSHEYFPIRNRKPDLPEIEPEFRELMSREIVHEQEIHQQFSLRERMGRRFREKFYVEMIYRRYVKPKRRVKVITLVREPVAHNASMFFQTVRRYIGPDADPSECDTDELINIFIDRYRHWRPLTWLDAEIKTCFGIDIFQYPFSIEQGYAVIKEGNTDLLVLRCELDDHKKEQAIADFLGLDEFGLVRSNVRSEKPEAQKYADFKRRLKLPPALLDLMYDSKYAKHFYSSEERDLFRERWGGESASE
jgi:hypothetical protein